MSKDNIDSKGFRENVGIIIGNSEGQLLLASRLRNKGWQFPQGGIHDGETIDEAMYRELYEEVGLRQTDVEVLGVTADWLKYRLPDQYVRQDNKPLCIGQKQKWYMLKLISNDKNISLDTSSLPEFDKWKWVPFWKPVAKVIYFKRLVYFSALNELGPALFKNEVPIIPNWWPRQWQEKCDRESIL